MTSWITLFGNSDGISTQVIRPKVEQWAKENNVEFVYKEATKAVRDEYTIEVVPTARYFNQLDGNPRIEGQGEIGITRLMRSAIR